VRDALEGVFGEGSTEGVEVVYRPWYVRAHLIFLGSLRGEGSVTRPERIYTNIRKLPCQVDSLKLDSPAVISLGM